MRDNGELSHNDISGYDGEIMIDTSMGLLSTIRANSQVIGDLGIRNCPYPISLPKGLDVDGNLFFVKCTGLILLPDDLSVSNNLVFIRCDNMVQTAGLTQTLYSLAKSGCNVRWPEHFVLPSADDITRKIRMEEGLAKCEIILLTTQRLNTKTLDKISKKNSIPQALIKAIGVTAQILEIKKILLFFKNYLKNIVGSPREFLEMAEPLIQMIKSDPQNLLLASQMIAADTNLTPEVLVSKLKEVAVPARRAADFQDLIGAAASHSASSNQAMQFSTNVLSDRLERPERAL